MDPVGCPYGHCAGPAREYPMFFISYGTRAGPARHPYGHVRELTQPELAKILHRRRIWPYRAHTGPLRPPHGLFTGCLWSLMPQSHLTMRSVQFLAPVQFLARKAEWRARRNFTMVLFSWSHQAVGPAWLDAAVHLWLDRIIPRSPHGPRVMLVWVPYRFRKGILSFFHILGARAGPSRVPQGTLTDT